MPLFLRRSTRHRLSLRHPTSPVITLSGPSALLIPLRRLLSLPNPNPNPNLNPKMYSFHRPWLTRNQINSRIASTLSARGWDSNHLLAYLDEENVCLVLDDLFLESSDAALSFYFFRLSQRFTGSRHGLRATCTMVNISVSGNMNHVAMKHIRVIVSNEEWHGLVLEKLRETSRNREGLRIAYSMLVSCFVDAGMVDLGVDALRKVRQFGFFPSSEVYNSLLRVLLKTKRLELAWQVFAEMPDWEKGSKGLSLTLFIREFCEYGDFGSACMLLLGMENYGGEADIVAYTLVIHSLHKRGLLKEATTLMYKILEKGSLPDTVLISSVIDGYCKVGKLVEAKNILNFSGRVPDVFVYNSFILTLCRNGNVMEANEIFYEMFDLGMDPDCFNYTTIMDGYCKLCQVGKVMNFFAQMHKRGIRPAVLTYTVLIEAYCRIEDLTGAESVFSTLKRDGMQPDILAYNAIINGYSNKGSMHRVYELKYMMTQDGVAPDNATYNIIMHGLVKRGFMNDAREIFNELVRRGFSPDKFAFTNLIDSYSKEGNLGEAYLIWCSMSTKGVKPDIVTCNVLLNGFCQKQRMQDANVLFRKMLGLGLKPDLILYNTLIQGFCNVGDVNEACQLLIAMKVDSILPDNTTYRALVHGLERKGIENAEEIAAMKVQDTYMKNGFVLNESLHCACAYGDVADMDEILPMDLTNEFLTAQM